MVNRTKVMISYKQNVYAIIESGSRKIVLISHTNSYWLQFIIFDSQFLSLDLTKFFYNYSSDFCFITVISPWWSWFFQSASSARNQELQDRQIEKLKNDINNLLIYIRRVREKATWDATGLEFNEVSHEDLFGPEDMFSG